MVDVDIDNLRLGPPASECDLKDDQLWQVILRDLARGVHKGVWLGTPCTTFSTARQRRLRTPEHLYGRPRRSAAVPDGLTPEEHAEVQEGTYFALRSIAVLECARAHGIPAALENPRPWEGRASIFLLPEMGQYLSGEGVVTPCKFAQICSCRQPLPINWRKKYRECLPAKVILYYGPPQQGLS